MEDQGGGVMPSCENFGDDPSNDSEEIQVMATVTPYIYEQDLETSWKRKISKCSVDAYLCSKNTCSHEPAKEAPR
jgi:hypothetical protein